MIKAGTPITGVGRGASVDTELARYNALANWRPKTGDFVIYHGWFRKRWYGIINAVDEGTIYVIKENLPVLLFTMGEDEYSNNTVKLSANKIRNALKGTYTIMRDGVWYV
jgi:hypothetical protein